MAHITAVCVLRTLLPESPGSKEMTAIDKRPVAWPVVVGPLGLAGDRQVDTEHHGGPEQAVYLYADEDAAWWSAELGRDIPPGLFGENLRTSGIDLSGTRIGQQLRIGESGLILEVTAPRTPCSKFAVRMGEPRWVKRFTLRRAPGAYARVVQPGVVDVGDEIVALAVPAHEVTVADVLPPVQAGTFGLLLDAERAGAVELTGRLRRKALKAVGG